jgi:CRISPR-associated protein Cmr4
LLQLAGIEADWAVPQVAQGQVALTAAGHDQLLDGGKLYLEAFEYTPVETELDALAEQLAELAISEDETVGFFRDKMAAHLVVLNDSDFNYFVENSTLVEPHVRIDPETGTADGGGLFYTENLPPESVMLAPLMTTAARGKEEISAEEIMARLAPVLDGRTIQLGGDATTGRGLVMCRMVQGG